MTWQSAAIEDSVFVGGASAASVADWIMHASQPVRLAVARMYPGAALVDFGLETPLAEHVRIDVFDVTGRRIRTLLNRTVMPGKSTVRWDGRSDGGLRVGSGVYFARAVAAQGTAAVRVPLLR